MPTTKADIWINPREIADCDIGFRPTEMMLLWIIEYTIIVTTISVTIKITRLMIIGKLLTVLPAKELAMFWSDWGISVLSGCL